jgi:hypothetical protein
VEEKHYKSFGKCVFLSNGIVEIAVTVDLGPRIIRFGFSGGENVLYEQESFDKSEPTNDVYSVFGDEGVWHSYGGHRLWISPEAMPRTYYPDNKPVSYTVEGNRLTVTHNPQNYTNFALTTAVELSPDTAEVYLCHKLTNIGAWPVEAAPWAVTVMAAGGTEIIPQPTRNTGLINNRVIGVWPYTKMNDSRVYFGDRYILLRQDKDRDGPFKIGLNSEHGYAAYVNRGNMFVKYFDTLPGALYPDGGMSYETYTNPDILEMESIGPLKKMSPGETVDHKEKWRLIKNVADIASNDETVIENLINLNMVI